VCPLSPLRPSLGKQVVASRKDASLITSGVAPLVEPLAPLERFTGYTHLVSPNILYSICPLQRTAPTALGWIMSLCAAVKSVGRTKYGTCPASRWPNALCGWFEGSFYSWVEECDDYTWQQEHTEHPATPVYHSISELN
jgi:hypothetical protein